MGWQAGFGAGSGTGLRAACLLLALGGLACATIPPEIEQARGAYGEAVADSELASRAGVELYEASKTIDAAGSAWEEGDAEEGVHLSYVAERQIEIARVAARRKESEAELARLSQERERVILMARTSEADALRLRAEAKAREAERAAQQARVAQERAAELEREVAELGAKRSERGLVLTLGDVLFDTNRANLRAGAVRNLYSLITFLKENPDRKVIIEGHTDSTGTASYNIGLSQKRADSVGFFLAQHGIGADRVTAVGYGEDFPLATNATAAGRPGEPPRGGGDPECGPGGGGPPAPARRDDSALLAYSGLEPGPSSSRASTVDARRAVRRVGSTGGAKRLEWRPGAGSPPARAAARRSGSWAPTRKSRLGTPNARP